MRWIRSRDMSSRVQAARLLLERSMLTSVNRRFLTSAQRLGASLVASGLVLALTTTTAGAAPAQDLSTPAKSVTGPATADTLDPTFVQEGTPSPHGGQVVGWGRLGGPLNGSSPRALPDGVYAAGLFTTENQILVLRSDGRVDSHPYNSSGGSAQHLAPPEGTTYTAVSTNWFGNAELLRSDGVVVNGLGEETMVPPDGLEYIAVSGHLGLLSDGTLGPASPPERLCPEMRDPGPGLGYTALSVRPGLGSWAALRNDGAFVYCKELAEGSQATIVEPPSDTRFIGIDMGSSEVVAATDDGRVVSSNGKQLAAAPAGRSIVSLAAMDPDQGAATLDDGSILSWGLSGREAALPALPAGRDVFSAVGGVNGYGQHWAILVGDPVAVDVTVVPTLPTDRALRVTDSVRLDVSAMLADGTPVAGQAEIILRAPDGQTATPDPLSLWSEPAEFSFTNRYHTQIGTHTVELTFSGSPYVTTTVETSLDFTGPSPVQLTASGPTTWHQGSPDTLCFTLTTEDGSRLWWTRYGQATISVQGESSQVAEVSQPHYPGSSTEACMESLDLLPGTYTASFEYEGWGETDSASWIGQIDVMPPAATQIQSDLPLTWYYGQMPDFVGVDVSAGSLTPIGTTVLRLEDGMWFGAGVQLDSNGHGRIPIGHEDELVPGSHSLTVVYQGGSGFSPSRLERGVTVKPAPFTTATPTITGTPRVGSTLTAVPGTWSPTPASFRYAWKIDGVAVAGATSSTFTVPASAAGKKITVTVTGLKQYYESSATSVPTAAVTVQTFTAPKPAIKGTAQVGRTLTVTRGTWSPSPSSVKYVWKANGTTISTQTSSSFVVPASAKGKRLTVTVTGSRTGYTTRSVTSSTTRTVVAGTFSAPRPAIKGTTRVGSTLTVVRGTWTPSPSSLKYVWKANGVTIATRTSSTFVVPARARGKQLTVTVTGAKAGYTSKSVASYRTATIR